jgi:thiol-disulfide isomerase/thioredoxin
MNFPIRFAFLLLISVFALSLPVSAQKTLKPVTINGVIPDKGNFKQIYLDTLNTKNPWIFAASDIDEQGKFSMTAQVNETGLYRLRLDDQNFMMLILEPGENVTISAKASKLGADAKIEGSENTALLYQGVRSVQFYDNQAMLLDKQYKDAQNSPAKDSLSAVLVAKFRANDSLAKASLRTIISSKPSSLAWLFFLSFQEKFDMNTDFDFISRTEAAMYKTYPNNEFVRQFHQKVDLERFTAIGSPAPDIELPGTDGKMRKLSSLKGSVVLLDFWASWCGPCRKENPNVVAIYSQYHDKGFEVFSVSLDKDRDSWLAAIAKDKLVWPNHVSDLKYWKSAGAAIYGVSSIPYTVLIDKKGRIVAKKLRGEELEAKVKELCK